MLLQIIRQKFSIADELDILFQYFDTDWNTDIDIEELNAVPNKSKVKCIVRRRDNTAGIKYCYGLQFVIHIKI